MKRVKRIIGTLCILFPVFLLFICGVMLIGLSDESEDGDPVHASGLGLSDKVREYAAFVGDTAAEYNIHEYEKYLLAIMMVETGGEGNDPMQSLGNSGLTEEEKKEQQILRREYVDAFKRNLRGQLNNISIKEKDGSSRQESRVICLTDCRF